MQRFSLVRIGIEMINDTLSAKILWHYIIYLQLPFRISFPEVYLDKLESYQHCFLTVGLHFEKKQSKDTSFWLRSVMSYPRAVHYCTWKLGVGTNCTSLWDHCSWFPDFFFLLTSAFWRPWDNLTTTALLISTSFNKKCKITLSWELSD